MNEPQVGEMWNDEEGDPIVAVKRSDLVSLVNRAYDTDPCPEIWLDYLYPDGIVVTFQEISE